MKLVALAFFLIAVAVAQITDSVDSPDTKREWEDYKKKFNKSYVVKEDYVRLKIYLVNKKLIEEHYKKEELNSTVGINEFTDLTNEEFAKNYQSFKKPSAEPAKSVVTVNKIILNN